MAASCDAIRLIAGLGNPGAQYECSRHNAGFWFVDALAEQYKVSFQSSKQLRGDVAALEISGNPVRLFKPHAYVNVSGAPIAAACRYYKIPFSALLVAQDDIDLEDGVVRLKYAGGHGGHKGVRDIVQHAGADFWRLKFGVGHPGRTSQVVSHVLRPLSEEERIAVMHAVRQALEQVDALVAGDFQAAMNVLHTANGASG